MNDVDDNDNAPEHILVQMAKAGDGEAFTRIMQRYKHPVLDFIYRMTGDPDAAQDLAQDVFVRAWRGIGRFEQRPDAMFSTWLFQIARNTCRDVHRRRARDPLHAAAEDSTALEEFPSRNSVANDVAAREIGKQVAAAVANLPEKQRTAVVLSEYEGLSYKEIAAVMNCSVKSVEARLYRAKQVLRRVLTRSYENANRHEE